MNLPIPKIGQVLAVIILGSSLAWAQEDLGADVRFKLRTGMELGTNNDNLKARTLGFGLDLGYVTPYGRWGLEAGMQYKPGDQYKVDVSTFPVVPGQLPPSNAWSGDLRRNSLEGLAIRLSFDQKLANSPWGWRAGVQLGGAKFRHEYLGDISPNSSYTYEDTYNGAATKSVLAPSPFLGLSYRFDDISSVEINLVGLGYTAINYVHVAGQNVDAQGHSILTKDYFVESKRMLPHIEVGYTFRF